MDNIFLIGFMGAGKSSVAKAISQKYNKRYIELDKEIELEAGRSIPNIFEIYGEVYFRECETRVLRLIECTDTVISCGGGIVLKDENIELLREKGRIIWLKAQPLTIYERIKAASERPLLKGNMTPEYIEELLASRIEKYERAATDSISTDYMDIEQSATYIYEKYMK